MKKRLFPMEYLRISQSRYGEYSHKNNNAYDLVGKDIGIDGFIATYPFIVLSIYKFNHTNGSGFANTVHFYDDENDVTVALTHTNDVGNLRVGYRVSRYSVIYTEGTTGRASGNHIHLEIGKGRQIKKKKIGNTYKLINQINIEDYFYIDETIKVLDTKGLIFERVGEEKMNLGYYEFKEETNDLIMYFQKPSLRLGLISASKDNSDYKALKTIDKLDDERKHFFKANGGYFQMGGAENGQHYGVEVNHKVEFVPRQKGYEVIYLLKNEDKLKMCNATEYYFNRNDIDFAITPYSIIYYNGEYINRISKGIGNKEKIKNTQTFLIQLKSNQCILGNFKNKVYPREVAEWAKDRFKEDLSTLVLFDSGGSSQCVLTGSPKLYTGRAIANALTFYEVEKPTSFREEIKLELNDKVEDEKDLKLAKLEKENRELKQIIIKAIDILRM